jgi:uncharacterized protein (TIGR02678 family)
VADLATALDEERAMAVRALLGSPLLDSAADADSFRLIVRHGEWLTTYFEQTAGWSLAVDAAAGFARLGKRAAASGEPRPLRRTRGDRGPFDRRRYQLLCLVCAQLVRHPVTTIGLLATAVSAEAALDTSKYGERGALVDALRALVAWGALRVTSGEIDTFLDSDNANALLVCDTTRLHRLLVSSVAPSALPDDADTAAATVALRAEPRYGDAEGAAASDDVRLRWARHRVGRRLLDDPVVHLDDLSQTERDYLANPGGRRWARDRVAEAGMELEERGEGLLAVDPDRIATDAVFPAPQGNAHQLALLLVDRLLPLDVTGHRQLGRLSPHQLDRAVEDVLAKFPRWARAARGAGGAARLTRKAIHLLAGFGLVRRDPDGTVTAQPALARYRVAEPIATGRASLFDEEMS